MTPDQFLAWRRLLHLSQAKAAAALGISVGTVENYERGRRRDTKRPVAIPRHIALACSAVAHGLPPYGN